MQGRAAARGDPTLLPDLKPKCIPHPAVAALPRKRARTGPCVFGRSSCRGDFVQALSLLGDECQDSVATAHERGRLGYRPGRQTTELDNESRS